MRIAVGGIAAALAVVLLLANNFITTATLALTATAAAVVFFVSVEFGTPLAAAVYVVSSLLSALFVSSNPNVFWMFTLMFGLYCVLKRHFDMVHSRVVKITVKFSFAVLSLVAYGCILLFVLDSAELVQQFDGVSLLAIILLIAVCIAMFFLYDFCLTRLAGLYYANFRKRIFGKAE